MADTHKLALTGEELDAALAKAAALPGTTQADNGKFLVVVGGVPTWTALTNVAEEGA